jgi:acyl carrier protein
MNLIEETIRNYIETSLLDGQLPDGQLPNGRAPAGRLQSDDDLLTILDSLQILRMLLDLEAEYSVKVDNSELLPENLGTIRRLAGFIARKQQESACQESSS